MGLPAPPPRLPVEKAPVIPVLTMPKNSDGWTVSAGPNNNGSNTPLSFLVSPVRPRYQRAAPMPWISIPFGISLRAISELHALHALGGRTSDSVRQVHLGLRASRFDNLLGEVGAAPRGSSLNQAGVARGGTDVESLRLCRLVLRGLWHIASA